MRLSGTRIGQSDIVTFEMKASEQQGRSARRVSSPRVEAFSEVRGGRIGRRGLARAKMSEPLEGVRCHPVRPTDTRAEGALLEDPLRDSRAWTRGRPEGWWWTLSLTGDWGQQLSSAAECRDPRSPCEADIPWRAWPPGPGRRLERPHSTADGLAHGTPQSSQFGARRGIRALLVLADRGQCRL